MNRREFLRASAAAAIGAGVGGRGFAQPPPDYTVQIGPCTLEASPHHVIKTIGYNGSIPGPLLRMREGRPVRIEVVNRTQSLEIVHWHGLYLPSEVDGAMEEGTPMIAPGASVRYEFTPRPAGFRWYHTHTSAGGDLRKAQYTGQHGFLFIEPDSEPGSYDREEFLALHDWGGQMLSSGDGSMNPVYDLSTINGRVLGFGEPIRVKQGERLLLHVLNSSATEVHWIALAGHQFRVIALDGNPVPRPATAPMLRLAPAERVCAVVEMQNPGVWVMGEVRKHVRAAGMGIVVEYAGAEGEPVWQQPKDLVWGYEQFGERFGEPGAVNHEEAGVEEIPLVLQARFKGHGAMERWTINGRSYPDVPEPVLLAGRRYRLRFENKSLDDHPLHLHRHAFELKQLPGAKAKPPVIYTKGIMKDTVLVNAGTEAAVEFVANDPGLTLLHCHQQDHMDMGFMMLFRYA